MPIWGRRARTTQLVTPTSICLQSSLLVLWGNPDMQLSSLPFSDLASLSGFLFLHLLLLCPPLPSSPQKPEIPDVFQDPWSVFLQVQDNKFNYSKEQEKQQPSFLGFPIPRSQTDSSLPSILADTGVITLDLPAGPFGSFRRIG